MERTARNTRWLNSLAAATLAVVLAGAAQADVPSTPYWENVDEVRTGMKGVGKTVLKGTEIVEFQAEVLGVLKHAGPAQDMVLVRLSGCGLEQTGVIAGMSGSPIYIDGKLLGAVAHTWTFGKEPVAGVTPFVQMRGLSGEPLAASASKPQEPSTELPTSTSSPETIEEELAIDADGSHSIGVIRSSEPPAELAIRDLSERAVSHRRARTSADLEMSTWSMLPILDAHATPALPVGPPLATDTRHLMPVLPTPLVASGLGPQALSLLTDQLGGSGVVPIAGGAATASLQEEVTGEPLVPGAPLAISLIVGDMELTGMGTVTHVEGQEVWGWGHSFMSLGECEYPLRSGYIHTVYPRQSLSMKLGSGLQTIGTITSDVSTCVAGRLGPAPDLLPVHVSIERSPQGKHRDWNVEVVRDPRLLSTLLATVLVGAMEAEGSLPEELTLDVQASVKPQGYDPIVLEDTYSGRLFAGDRGWANVFSQVATIAQTLVHNPFRTVPLESVDCRVQIRSGWRAARIESVELSSERYEPGETLRARVVLHPYKGAPQVVDVDLPLPKDLPPGRYQAWVCDFPTHIQRKLQEQAYLLSPRSFSQMMRALQVQLGDSRQTLFLRVPMPEGGVALDGQALPRLPDSVRAVLASRSRTAVAGIRDAFVVKQTVPWVVEGSHQLAFQVVKDKGLTR